MVFALKVLQKLTFMEIVFSEFRDGFVSFWGGLGSRFSIFFGFENRLGNETIFAVVKNPEFVIWGGGFTRNLGSLKTQA